MIWAFRIAVLAILVFGYRASFRDLDGFWPVAGMALCIAAYIAITTLIERTVLAKR